MTTERPTFEARRRQAVSHLVAATDVLDFAREPGANLSSAQDAAAREARQLIATAKAVLHRASLLETDEEPS